MDDQKRLFIAIILSIVVMVGWEWLFTDKTPVKQNSKTEQTVAGQNTAKSGSRQNSKLPDKNAVSAVNNAGTGSTSDYNPEGAKGKIGGKTGNTAALKDAAGSSNNYLSLQNTNYRKISVSTPYYNIIVSENRAAVTSLTLKKYRETMKKNSPLKELVPSGLKSGVFSLDLKEKSIPGLSNAVFTAGTDSDKINLVNGKKRIVFSWRSRDGVVVEKVYTFSASTYLIGLNIFIKNGSQIPIKDDLDISIPGHIDKSSSRYSFHGPVALIDGKLQEIKIKKIKEKDLYPGTIDWAGFTSRYFISCLIPEKPVAARIKLSTTGATVTTEYILPMERLAPDKQMEYAFNCYMGPKSLKVLSQYKNTLKQCINFGWFDILAKPCLIAMNIIYDFIPNYGIAIILLTILIKLIFWPLGTKSYKSMNDMKRVQPLMTELRQKYKDDKQKMNQEVMALYKTYKVNPMSGCLPMVVQMPIFFALYRMLYQAIELRHAPFFGWIQDLSAPDRLFHFAFTIPFVQPPTGIPVLTIIMGATMFLQQKMSPTTGDPTQAKMMMLMPLFMTVIFVNFPAGLVLYWLVNNVLSIGQQYYIQKKFA